MRVLWILFSFTCLISCSHISQESQTESERLRAFFERAYERNLSRYPVWQTYLGRKTNYGKLNNATREYSEEQHRIDEENLKKLHEFDYDKLDETAKLSYQIYEYRLKNKIEGFEKWYYHGYPLNQMFGFHSHIPSLLINMHRVENKSDAEAYISRLKEVKRFFAEKQSYMEKQVDKGIIPPDFVYSKVLDDSKNVITGAPFEKGEKASPLFKDFKKKVKKLDLSDREKVKLKQKAKKALIEYVGPAYRDLMAFTKRLDKKANSSLGVWALPKGDEYYRFRLEKMTTTKMRPEEIHKVGLKEVERIHNEMREIMDKVGFQGNLQEFFDYMKSDRFTYPDTEDGREAYLKKTRKIIKGMQEKLPSYFATLPKAELKVKAVEPYREKSAGIAFYNGPSLEGDRPGIYYVNLYKMEDNPKYKMEALAYHEAVPGHHMQIAIAKELENLPKFRRTGGFTAYIEGWGLYAERLPKEMGFYEDPYSDFGRLAMELWRACRLVVDTGIHDKHWSREKGIAYLKKNTPNAELEIEKAVERYFVMPAQATSYKIGMMKILELREKAREQLGDEFDIREFHDVVLRAGALPLTLLEKRVEKWVKSERNI